MLVELLKALLMDDRRPRCRASRGSWTSVHLTAIGDPSLSRFFPSRPRNVLNSQGNRNGVGHEVRVVSTQNH
jgi:hypothetical protein